MERECIRVWEGKVTFKATAAVCLINEAMKVRTELDFDGPLPLLWGAPRPFRFSHPPTTQVAVLHRMPCEHTQWSDFVTDRVSQGRGWREPTGALLGTRDLGEHLA